MLTVKRVQKAKRRGGCSCSDAKRYVKKHDICVRLVVRDCRATFVRLVALYTLSSVGEGVFFMENRKENRIAVVSILVSDRTMSDKVNALLSEYGEWILGRMGIPYKEKQVSVLSVVLDAPVEVTNALTGKLGRIDGVSVKALFGKI